MKGQRRELHIKLHGHEFCRAGTEMENSNAGGEDSSTPAQLTREVNYPVRT